MSNQTKLALFLERLKCIVPNDQYDQVSATFSQPRQIGLRFPHYNKTFAIPLKPTWIDHVYLCAPQYREQLTHCDAFNSGQLYIQNISSMLPALVLDLKPELEILDLCAAPGSKTSQMAMLIKSQGHIAAVERSKKRFFKLQDNLKRQGITCVKTFLRDGKTVFKHCRDQFDRVLVDAPCSTEAQFDFNNPESCQHWDLNNTKKIARDQWQLLYSGFVSLKPGGILVYATCTYSPEENEMVVQKLLKKFPDSAQLLEIDLPLKNTQSGLLEWQGKAFDPSIINCMRILPTYEMEGFFMAKITKKK